MSGLTGKARTEMEERIDRLTSICEEMQELVGEAKQLVRGTSIEGHANAYWLAHLMCSLTSDHGYLSRDATMADDIEELRDEMNGTGEFADDDEESED